MIKQPIKILAFSGCYLPGYKGGGPIKTLKNLFDLTGDQLSFKLITSDRDLGDITPYESIDFLSWNQVGKAQVFYIQSGKKGISQYWIIFKERQYDLIYLNSFFSLRFSIIPLLMAKLLKQKVVLGPRGEFSKGALNLKAKKKRFFISLYKILRLQHNVVFQASSNFEKDDIQRIFGNEVDVQIAEDIGTQDFVESISERSDNTLHIITVARISPMKNLLTALKTFKQVQSPVEYHIYGPIEDTDYWQQCLEVIKDLPSHIQVKYQGELHPNEVLPTMSNYDLFFMPTQGENYGHVIAEAFCAGLPVLIANTTPWRNLQEQGIGWDLPLNTPEAFSTTIDEVANMSFAQHKQMRETVLAWAKNKFSQRDAIEANIAIFHYAYEKK